LLCKVDPAMMGPVVSGDCPKSNLSCITVEAGRLPTASDMTFNDCS
jgi:hypothetical protein